MRYRASYSPAKNEFPTVIYCVVHASWRVHYLKSYLKAFFVKGHALLIAFSVYVTGWHRDLSRTMWCALIRLDFGRSCNVKSGLSNPISWLFELCT